MREVARCYRPRAWLGERDAGDLVAHVVVMQVLNDDHVAARVGVETRKVAVGFRRIELGGDLVKEHTSRSYILVLLPMAYFQGVGART